MMTRLRIILRWHRPLAWFAAAMALLGVVSVVGYVIDPRVVTGAPLWAKPFKFAVSFLAYSLTLAWMLSTVHRPRLRTVGWWAGTVLAAASTLEMAAITLQVIRGRASHFNVSTPFDAQVYAAMGILVFVIYTATLVVAGVLIASPQADRAAAWAVRLGLGLSVAGLSVGFLMVAPRSEQISDPDPTVLGAHAVDVADGGPGLPLVGWSTTGGDLRIAHFIGMHGLQALPLVVIALTLIPAAATLTRRTRVQIIVLAASAYAGVFALTLWQALRGQAITSPDALTLSAAGALVLACGAGALAISRAARRAGRIASPVDHADR